MLRKTLLALGCAAGLGFSANAQAATIFFDLTPPNGTFSASNIGCDVGAGTCSGDFTATGSFDAPLGYKLVQGSIETNAIDDLTNLDFGLATLNGEEFELFSVGNGVYEFGFLSPILLGATNTLVVSGFTGGAGAFTGSLTFAAAIPEPATWGLMILGFGAVGAAMRRKKTVSAKLNFA